MKRVLARFSLAWNQPMSPDDSVIRKLRSESCDLYGNETRKSLFSSYSRRAENESINHDYPDKCWFYRFDVHIWKRQTSKEESNDDFTTGHVSRCLSLPPWLIWQLRKKYRQSKFFKHWSKATQKRERERESRTRKKHAHNRKTERANEMSIILFVDYS